jgi:TolB-like protein/lipopolysaccharide biosynthesis regulator YciM
VNPKAFFGELRRRNVYKVAIAYGIVAWLLMQVASQIFPFFEIPNWVVRMVVLLLIIGFPVALVIAWAFEITPEGIKRTEDVGPTQPRSHGGAWIYIALIGAALSVGLFFVGRYTATPSSEATIKAPEKSIAVLPFESLSEEKANAYFAEGVQDEILTKLSTIRDLKVISRTSTAKYQSKPENLRSVAEQLGIANVLEGSVQRAEGKVRVNVQLIDALKDTHLWAKSYDREFKDVFAVQSEIAQDIADTLRTRLSSAETKALSAAPTGSVEAYDLFLKAEYEERRAESFLTAEALDRAATFYKEAIGRDPAFALAFARLAINRLYMHWHVNPLTPADLAQVKLTIDRAISLGPELAEAQIALGIYHYWGFRDYEPALAAFRRAVEQQPNNARAHAFMGYIYRRRGEWEKSLAEAARADELDPLDAVGISNRGITYLLLRQWTEAEQLLRRALTLEPQSMDAVEALCETCENSRGDLECSRRVLASIPTDNPVQFNQIRGEASGFTGARAYLDVLERNFARAFEHWARPLNDTVDARRQQLEARVVLHAVTGSTAAAQQDAEELRAMHERRLQQVPDDFYCMSALSWAYLCLGRSADALQMAHRASGTLPYEKDAFNGGRLLAQEAQISALAGQTQQAIKILQRLLSSPNGRIVSTARLKIDPVWDPIRNDPGFQKLLQGPELIGPNK